MPPAFVHFDLRIIEPSFSSPLLGAILELEHLRKLRLHGDTPVPIFYQIKDIFHMLESLGSARIEGNNTTLADYIESKIDPESSKSEHTMEIANIEVAMDFIEKSITEGSPIDHELVRHLHYMSVNNLTREGDKTPGSYRNISVKIQKSNHTPPDAVLVQPYMDDLLNFINNDNDKRYDLLKIALAHHRFAWIHPFSNGNGRVVRLMTYALLIKFGFNVRAGGRILNPTAVFCNNRDKYYEMLSKADAGTDKGLEEWSTYMLTGILEELSKVDILTKYSELKEKILFPAIEYASMRQLITQTEKSILRTAIEKGSFKSADLGKAAPNLTTRQRTYQLQKLSDNKMIRPVKSGSRIYTIQFTDNVLIRGIVDSLVREGLVPKL